MSNECPWERRFVEQYIVRAKRARYLSFLRSKKNRPKFLRLLNHNLDFDPSQAERIAGSERTHAAIHALLSRHGVASTAHFIADSSEHDGEALELAIAVDEFLSSYSGAVLVCPPKPIALYKEEDIGEMFIFGAGAA